MCLSLKSLTWACIAPSSNPPPMLSPSSQMLCCSGCCWSGHAAGIREKPYSSCRYLDHPDFLAYTHGMLLANPSPHDKAPQLSSEFNACTKSLAMGWVHRAMHVVIIACQYHALTVEFLVAALPLAAPFLKEVKLSSSQACDPAVMHPADDDQGNLCGASSQAADIQLPLLAHAVQAQPFCEHTADIWTYGRWGVRPLLQVFCLFCSSGLSDELSIQCYGKISSCVRLKFVPAVPGLSWGVEMQRCA